MSFGREVHSRLQGLDRSGTAYHVQIDGDGVFRDVLSHSPDHIATREEGVGAILWNLEKAPSIMIEEL